MKMFSVKNAGLRSEAVTSAIAFILLGTALLDAPKLAIGGRETEVTAFCPNGDLASIGCAQKTSSPVGGNSSAFAGLSQTCPSNQCGSNVGPPSGFNRNSPNGPQGGSQGGSPNSQGGGPGGMFSPGNNDAAAQQGFVGYAWGGTGQQVGDPIDVVGKSIFDHSVDLTIPVKHGLSLTVERIYSSRYIYAANHDGDVPLGYSDASTINSNWFLGLYDSNIWPTTPTLCTAVMEAGNWIHFGYNGTTNYTDGNKLRDPYASSWSSSIYASLYYPIGDPNATGYTDEKRQTNEDWKLFILHNHNPTSESDRIASTNIAGYVLRNADGRQYHYGSDGHLRFVDANWRNNTASGASGHVDDYLEVTWITSRSLASGGHSVKTIDEVKAPPSDGRKLKFHHYLHSDFVPKTNVYGISLVLGSTTYDNLVQYEYQSGGTSDGKLWRVWEGDPTASGRFGIQYNYGYITTSGNTVTVNTGWQDSDLCLTSEVLDNGGGSYTTTAIMANHHYWVSTTIEHFRQLVKDPNPAVGDWRIAFDVDYEHSPTYYTLTWKDGEKIDGSGGRYNPSLANSAADYYRNYNHDVEAIIPHDDADNPPPLTKKTYVDETTGPLKRLLEGDWLWVSGSEGANWVKTAVWSYNDDSGIQRITSVKKYPDYDWDSGAGIYVAREATALETTYAYDDSDLPEEPSTITQPDGRQLVIDYDSLGRIGSVTVKQKNKETSAFDSIGSTAYTYLSTGTNAGLLSSTTWTPTIGHAIEIDYTYSTGSTRAGEVTSVTRNSLTASYTLNVFGGVLTASASEGTATYTWSGAGQSDTRLPPRLLKVEDPAGNQTTIVYNTRGQVTSTTEAYGTGSARTTDYAYDRFGSTAQVSSPGEGDTDYVYDIYGNLLTQTDAGGTVTAMNNDAWGRVYKMKVKNGSTVKYEVDYAYVSVGGTCGACGGGGAKAVAKRTIIDGSNSSNYEELFFSYDLIGRPFGRGTTSDANDVIYGFTDTHLTTVTHANGSYLWGTNALNYQYDKYNRPAKEVYPNGRTVSFEYDPSTPADRLIRVKDPFGCVTNLAYDSMDRLLTLDHSTLGSAALAYVSSTVNRVTSMTLGNGAHSDYTYDGYGRMTAFDLKNGSSSRLLKHDWSYDALLRKGDINVTIPESTGISQIDLTYDSANRVTREKLVATPSNIWDIQYGYDSTFNRTSINDGSINKTIGYGTGNRETSVSGGGTAETYDYKGNVTVRPPLSGGNSYNYTWDVYDRLTLVTRTGANTGEFLYDAGGRMLARVEFTDEYALVSATFNYWLGLNKIAEERFVSTTNPVFRPDTEASTNPESNGWWQPYASTPTMEYVNDADRGNVLHLPSQYIEEGWADLFAIGEAGGTFSFTNPNDDDFGTANGIAEFWMKNAAETESGFVYYVDTATSGPVMLVFATGDGTDYIEPEALTYNFFLGTDWNDWTWRFMELDLDAYIKTLAPSESLTGVHAFVVAAADMYIDDHVLAGGKLEKSYQIIPGGLNYLGCQSGSLGGISQDPWAKWYYQTSDLGTNMVVSDASGAKIAIAEPDGSGRYRYVSGTMPDTLGLTSKFKDPLVWGYYFGARWLDQERGRWFSEEPTRADGPNAYHFVFSDLYASYDASGLDTYRINRKLGAKKGQECTARSVYNPITHTFIAVVDDNGTIHTYSWGNTANTKGWNINQPEDIEATKDALSRDVGCTREGGKDLDEFIPRAFAYLNKKQLEHDNGIIWGNCKGEASNLTDLAELLRDFVGHIYD